VAAADDLLMNKTSSADRINQTFAWAQTRDSYCAEQVTSYELRLAYAAGMTQDPVEQQQIASQRKPFAELSPEAGEAFVRGVERLFPQDTYARLTGEGQKQMDWFLRNFSLRRPVY
jgi:hypothetical protein